MHDASVTMLAAVLAAVLTAVLAAARSTPGPLTILGFDIDDSPLYRKEAAAAGQIHPWCPPEIVGVLMHDGRNDRQRHSSRTRQRTPLRSIRASGTSGSKYKLLPHLADVFSELGGTTALDAFSGSGVVSYLLKRQGFAVTSNDMLEFPGVLATATVVKQSERPTDSETQQIIGPAADDRDFTHRARDGLSRIDDRDGDRRRTQRCWLLTGPTPSG